MSVERGFGPARTRRANPHSSLAAAFVEQVCLTWRPWTGAGWAEGLRGGAAARRAAQTVLTVCHGPTGSENEVTQVNRCLDAAKACNVDEMCQRLRTEYVSLCIRRLARADSCNRSKCHKALRRFFDRVPPEFTHELLFCPCDDTACAERRRQTIVPACSYEAKDKPNCLAPLDSCRENYVCR